MGHVHSRHILKALRHPENEEKAREAFDYLDADKSGGLDPKEFEGFARVVLKVDLDDKAGEDEYMVPLSFEIDYGEVIEKLRTHHIQEFSNRMFHRADANRDDVVSFDEFVAFLKIHAENPYDVSGLKKYEKDTVLKEALHEVQGKFFSFGKKRRLERVCFRKKRKLFEPKSKLFLTLHFRGKA
jgi:Ca2+-binding EF-hand superfamily protein